MLGIIERVLTTLLSAVIGRGRLVIVVDAPQRHGPARMRARHGISRSAVVAVTRRALDQAEARR